MGVFPSRKRLSSPSEILPERTQPTGRAIKKMPRKSGVLLSYFIIFTIRRSERSVWFGHVWARGRIWCSGNGNRTARLNPNENHLRKQKPRRRPMPWSGWKRWDGQRVPGFCHLWSRRPGMMADVFSGSAGPWESSAELVPATWLCSHVVFLLRIIKLG